MRPLPLVSVLQMSNKWLLDRENFWTVNIGGQLQQNSFVSWSFILYSTSWQPFVHILYTKDFKTCVEEGLASLRELICCPEGALQRGCAAPVQCVPFPSKIASISVVKVLWRRRYWGEKEVCTIYYRNVSVVESLPGVSGLTSTLTQATFSWLFRD